MSINQTLSAEAFLGVIRIERGELKDTDMPEAMIEFAKMHVQAALRAANNHMIEKWPAHWDIVDEAGIRNAYPLNLIT
jgi:hypothetical protein